MRKLMILTAVLAVVALFSTGAMAAGPHVSVPKGEAQGTFGAVLLKQDVSGNSNLALEWGLQYGLDQDVHLDVGMFYPGNISLRSIAHLDAAWQINKYIALFGGGRLDNYDGGISKAGFEGGATVNLQVGYSVVRGTVCLASIDNKTVRDTEIGLEVPFGYRTNLEFSYREMENLGQGLSMALNLAF